MKKYLLILATLALLAAACTPSEPPGRYQGYVEAELTYLAAPAGGYLQQLAVQRGQAVKAGQPAFRLEAFEQRQAVEAAQRQLQQAQARLADLKKGQRPSEIAAIQAALARAQSALRLSRLEYHRRQKLYAQKSIAKEQLDQSHTAFLRDQAQVAEISAQLETARLGARSDQIQAAAEEVRVLEARLAQARWSLERMSQNVLAAGRVFDTFYTVGEWVPAGQPVLALLLPGDVKVRFFVPEEQVSALRLGQEVRLSCDGCPAGLTAAVSYISPLAEYTPPVIYSQETRAKLVFLVEARPTPGQPTLHPGQPMQVSLAAAPSR